MEPEDPPHLHFGGCGCAGYELSNEDDNLWDVIDKANITCLNEKKGNTCKSIFRHETNKRDFIEELESPNGDAEFLLVVPFTEEVKIRAVNLWCASASKRPESVGLYVNSENFDYDLTDDEPVQTLKFENWTLDHQTETDTIITKFVRVHKLILHFKSESSDQIGLLYCGIRGIRTNSKRGVVHADYEKMAHLEDHKATLELMNKDIGKGWEGV
jgi:hypothetical protein